MISTFGKTQKISLSVILILLVIGMQIFLEGVHTTASVSIAAGFSIGYFLKYRYQVIPYVIVVL